MSQYNLRPLWDEILTIYEKVSPILNRHGLRHWLAYGTLLGAVRHSGFIPWDDDFDLMMPRRDYDSFIEIANSEMPNELELMSLETTGVVKYKQTFAKIKIASSSIVDEISHKTNLNLNQGIFIDVFPMDGLPSSELSMQFFCMVRAILRRINIQKQPLLLQRWAKRRDFDSADFVGVCNSDRSNYHAWHYPRSWFRETIQIKFDRIEAPVPIGYKGILKAMYGDYMQYPPPEARHPSHQA